MQCRLLLFFLTKYNGILFLLFHVKYEIHFKKYIFIFIGNFFLICKLDFFFFSWKKNIWKIYYRCWKLIPCYSNTQVLFCGHCFVGSKTLLCFYIYMLFLCYNDPKYVQRVHWVWDIKCLAFLLHCSLHRLNICCGGTQGIYSCYICASPWMQCFLPTLGVWFCCRGHKHDWWYAGGLSRGSGGWETVVPRAR